MTSQESDGAMPEGPDFAALSGLDQKDRIQILLCEYAALRDEAVARTGYGFQIPAVFLGGLTWFLQQDIAGRSAYFWLVMLFVLVCFGIAVFVNLRDLKRVAHRLKDLEHEINSRAGEHLLIWETLIGVLTRAGPDWGFLTLVKPRTRAGLPALDPSYLAKAVRDRG